MFVTSAPMLFSKDNFRVVAQTTAGSTESGRTPAFFYAYTWNESPIVDVSSAV
jgi:hypothetical protein